MTPREVVPGVFELTIGAGYVNAFFVVDAGRVTLVDAGLPNNAARILEAVRTVRSDAQVQDILITHRHVDHIGSLGRLAAETSAQVYAHPLDAPMIRGDAPNYLTYSGHGAEYLFHLFALVFGPKKVDPAPVHHEVSDGEPLDGGMRAIHTVGHTIGHVSYLLDRNGGNVLFVGDAVANLLGRLSRPIGAHDDSPPDIDRSVRKLAELEFDVACFGHGRSLRRGADMAFRRLAGKLSA